jgi:hypothetical protein
MQFKIDDFVGYVTYSPKHGNLYSEWKASKAIISVLVASLAVELRLNGKKEFPMNDRIMTARN